MSGFITEDELQAEYKRLDLLREEQTKQKLTDEQFKLIHYARTHGKPITFAVLAEYWEKRGWGKISDLCLRNWYERDKKINK